MRIDLDFAMDDASSISMDSMFLVLSMQIAEDYESILRQHIMPEFKHIKGLNLREMRVLRCVARDSFPLTGAEVAERLRYDPATVTRALKRLEGQEKIKRRPSPMDHRSEFIDVTPEGRKLADHYRDHFRATIQTLSEMQTEIFTHDELEQFVYLGKKLSRRAAQMRRIKPAEYAHLKKSA